MPRNQALQTVIFFFFACPLLFLQDFASGSVFSAAS
jgi:hypothetical protein